MTHLWWHVARAAGLVAWLFSALSLLTGVVMSSRAAVGIRRTNWQLDLHRIESTITVSAIGLRLAAIVADSYVHFGLLDLLVPGHAAWRSRAVAWGVVAMWTVAVVEATSLVRHCLPKRWWHGVHLLSIVAFFASTIHALAAGTDTSQLVVFAGVLLVAAVVLAAIGGRLSGALVHRYAEVEGDHPERRVPQRLAS